MRISVAKNIEEDREATNIKYQIGSERHGYVIVTSDKVGGFL